MNTAVPDGLIVASYARRGAGLWIGVRAVASLFTILAQGDLLNPTAGLAIGIVAASAALALLETHRRRERALLGNLGVSLPALTLMLTWPAATGELTFLAIAAFSR